MFESALTESALVDPGSPAAHAAPPEPDANPGFTPATPAYVYDLAEVRANAAALWSALPDASELYYSLKANPHPAVLGTLRSAGARAEVCSPGELAAALDAGFPPDQILYTGPGKRDEDVADALRAGVRLFSVDSPTALDQLDRLAGRLGVRARCLLRVNDDRPAPGQGLAMTGVASQFGADTGWILAEPHRFAGRPRASVVGLHLYMGTNLTEVGDLLAQFELAIRTAARLRGPLQAAGARIRTVDLGGGFGAPFARPGDRVALAGLREGLNALLDEHLPQWRSGAVVPAFESGRYLVGTAGSLLTTVLDVKRSHGVDVVVLDAGINHLGGMSGLRRLPPIAPRPLRSAAPHSDNTAAVKTMICGPLCTPLDTWARSVDLPAAAPGEVLEVPNVGAYGLNASLVAFLGHPLPLEVVRDGERVLGADRLELLRRTPAASKEI